jgi:hypothetical protein
MSKKLTPHPMVARILDPSGHPRETLLLVGYLAVPHASGPVRIYPDLTFEAYFEIPPDKVLYVQEADPSDETKPTKIVVDAKEPLRLVHAVEASFLRGSITATHPLGVPVGFGLFLKEGGETVQCTHPPPPTPSAQGGRQHPKRGVVQTQCPSVDGLPDS